MTVRFQQPYNSGIYFVTFTCHNWLPLIELSNSYGLVYKWFDYLKSKGHYIVGYVVMPNHLHVIIAFTQSTQSVNTQIGNGKRFLAYGIVQQLTAAKQEDVLLNLKEGVNDTDRKRGKLHQVFKASFDCKECTSIGMLETKLNYIHNNPCKGKWNLAESPIDYPHSSAGYYHNSKYLYTVTDYGALQDIDLSNFRNE